MEISLVSSNLFHILGHSLYVGPGAGRLPTANSVVADLLELANNITNLLTTSKSIIKITLFNINLLSQLQ